MPNNHSEQEDKNKESTKKAEKKEKHPLEVISAEFIESIKNIEEAAEIVLPHVEKWLKDERKKESAKIQRLADSSTREDGTIRVSISNARDYAEFSSAVRKIERLRNNKSATTVARGLLIQTFSELDAFTGSLLKCIYLRKGSLLKSIEREIKLSELIEFDSIESAKMHLLDKEIETFRRDSYIEQFAALESKFSISTLRKFTEWPEFVEISQRRNLFTHNDGIVSEQYLQVCQRENAPIGGARKGEQLEVDSAYIKRAATVISKTGFMLCHTLWSKVLPGEKDAIQGSIGSALYSALEEKRWHIAKEFGEFSLSDSIRKGAIEVEQRIRAINLSIALKFMGDEVSAFHLLDSVDWSASYRDFRLAIAVLKDEEESAFELMREIGRKGELINQDAYHSWPLFHKFRESPAFYATYEEVYGEPFATTLIEKNRPEKSTSLASIPPPKRRKKKSAEAA